MNSYKSRIIPSDSINHFGITCYSNNQKQKECHRDRKVTTVFTLTHEQNFNKKILYLFSTPGPDHKQLSQVCGTVLQGLF